MGRTGSGFFIIIPKNYIYFVFLKKLNTKHNRLRILVVVKEMNAQEYIESGIVLDYCLGLVTGQDKADFEQALKLYPELDQSLKLFRKV